jgi:putative phosphoribosyl transferase
MSQVNIGLKDVALPGILNIPAPAKGIVIFSHGSGSSRLSPRNNFVARQLQQAGLATLLFDLLTEEEDQYYENRFDIELLTQRLIDVTNWLYGQNTNLPIGYFGASTGAASALKAAARQAEMVKAVVSRGGRPDLAEEELSEVQAAVLLIVGGRDTEVIRLNESAYEKLHCKKQLEIVAGATHLFEEAGTLEEVARLATNFFIREL